MYISLTRRIFSLTIDLCAVFFINLIIQIGAQYIFNHQEIMQNVTTQYYENLFNTNIEDIDLNVQLLSLARITIYYILLQYFVMLSYFVTGWYFFSQTIGMFIMHIKLVDSRTRQKPTLTQVLLRNITSFTYPIGGFLFVLYSKKQQALHGLISGTVLIAISN